MKKMKRFLAALLAVSMFFGSTNYSVLASGGAEIGSESEYAEELEQPGTEEAGVESVGMEETGTENSDTEEAAAGNTGGEDAGAESVDTEEAAENADAEGIVVEGGDGVETEAGEGVKDTSETEADSEIPAEEMKL